MRVVFLWLIFPLLTGLAHPLFKEDPELLQWVSGALSLYVLFFSIVAHEVSHGLAAYWCGDPTAKQAGRLTLNPLSHVDPIGSIIVPLALHLLNSPLRFGWAKPVPFQAINLRQHPRDQVMIAVAGPLSNFGLAYLCMQGQFILAALLHAFPEWRHAPAPAAIVFVVGTVLRMGLLINLVLGIFNLIPFPPLDGSWILRAALPQKAATFFHRIQPYSFIILVAAVYLNLFDFFFYPAQIILSLIEFAPIFFIGG